MPGPFSCHRGVAPLLWMLIAVSVVELTVTHLLLSHWWPRVAIGLSVATAALTIGLIAFTRSIPRRPSVVDGEMLRMRTGWIGIDIPVAAIAGLREIWDAAALKQRGVLNLALLAYPNIVIDLDPPVARRRGGRPVKAVAHRLDDPQAFNRWIASACSTTGPAS